MTIRLRHWLPLILVVVIALGMTGWANEWFTSSTPDTDAEPSETTAVGDEETARRRLAELAVEPPGSMAGYSRDRFPHWRIVEGKCDTRETVLKRDGKDVKTDAECRIVSGTWTSPYDGATWTEASDIDIDHSIPLAAAWRSGAAEWTDERRKEFAGDMIRHQLIAVTDNVNQAKGDQTPDQWRPPLTSYWCTYSISWIEVKHCYQLSINDAEKNALVDMLNHC